MSDEIKHPSNPSSSQKTAFGMLKRIQKPNGVWVFQVLWGRVFIFFAMLFVAAWMALSLFLFILFKYVKDYGEMTFAQAIVLPFDRTGHRHKVSEYNLRTARQNIKDNKWRDAYLNLTSAVGRNQKNLEARMILAEFYQYLSNRPDMAIDVLEGALVYAINDLKYMRMYIKLLMDQSEDAKVVSVCEKLLNSGEVKNPEISAYLAMALSSVYAFHGNYAKSKEYLVKYKLEKTLPGILRLSKNEWEQGNRDEAINILANNFAYAQNKEPIYALLVNYYSAMNNFEKARQYSMLRNIENPFSLSQKMEYLRLLKKTGDEKGVQRDLNNLIKQYQNDNRSLLILANYAADTGDTDAMRRIYDIAIKSNYPPAPYCLLRLETILTNGDFKSATEFAEEILKSKPRWAKRYEDVISCLRAIAYYATGNVNMADILLSDVLKRGTASPKVQIATARRLSQMGAKMTALKLLENTVDRFPRHQLALTRLIQMEIELGNSTNLDKHIFRLLQMRRPPRELVAEARKNLASDRFIFTANRVKLMNEIDMLMKNTSMKVFSEGNYSDDNDRITSDDSQNIDF